MRGLREFTYVLINGLRIPPAKLWATPELLADLFKQGDTWADEVTAKIMEHMKDTDMVDSPDYQFALARLSRFLDGKSEPEDIAR